MTMKQRIMPLGLCVMALANGVAMANDASPPATCSDSRSATDIVDQGIRDWQQSEFGHAMQQRDAAGELVLLVSNPTLVGASTTSANFGKSRELAFAKAFLNTQVQFIQRRSQSIQSETASQYFEATPSQDDLTLKDGEGDGRLLRIGKKIFALTEAKIDRALRDEGVPEDDIAKIEASKKVDTYKDAIARKSVSKAFGELSGIVPVKNIEGTDCNNLAAVATVSVFSGKTLDFVKDVVSRRPILADPDKASRGLFTEVNDEVTSGDIIYNFGLRKTYDDKGYPSIVSYGQWSYAAGGLTPRAQEQKKRSALSHAEQNARAAIAQFLNSSGQAVVETMSEERATEFVEVFEDRQEQSSMSELVESTLEDYSTRANVTLQGLQRLTTWTMPYPGLPGVTLAGAVVAWSPQSADAINRATGKRAGLAASSTPGEPEAASLPAQLRGSKDKNHAADF